MESETSPDYPYIYKEGFSSTFASTALLELRYISYTGVQNLLAMYHKCVILSHI